MNLEAMTSSNNLKALRRLYDQVELHTRSLKSLGVESSSYGGLLASVLLNKLPQDLQLFVSRKIGESEWKLDEIMRVVEEELGARERTTAIAVNSIKKHTRESPTAAALFTRGASGVSCTYCQQAHSSDSCQVVSHPNAHKQVLQKAGRCFVCLRRGHISRECRRQGRCPKCGGKHHGSICSRGTDSSNAIPSVPDRSGNTTAASQSRANLSVPSTASSRDESATAQQSTLNAGAPSFRSQDSRSTTSLWVRSDQAVLLQTAQALAFNPEVPQKSQQVCIVLDCGSQRSYVTERLMKELSLNAQGEQPLTIMTFGSKEEKSQICKSARVGLLHKDGRAQQLRLLVVPLICEPLTYQPISFCRANFDHLYDLDFADLSNSSSCAAVDILIGSDLYWDLVTGESIAWNCPPIVPPHQAKHSEPSGKIL